MSHFLEVICEEFEIFNSHQQSSRKNRKRSNPVTKMNFASRLDCIDFHRSLNLSGTFSLIFFESLYLSRPHQIEDKKRREAEKKEKMKREEEEELKRMEQYNEEAKKKYEEEVKRMEEKKREVAWSGFEPFCLNTCLDVFKQVIVDVQVLFLKNHFTTKCDVALATGGEKSAVVHSEEGRRGETEAREAGGEEEAARRRRAAQKASQSVLSQNLTSHCHVLANAYLSLLFVSRPMRQTRKGKQLKSLPSTDLEKWKDPLWCKLLEF